jgi:hypothetical protein
VSDNDLIGIAPRTANRELSNVSWILEETDRFVPREDSLTVRAGVLGAYPNMFFVVPEDKINAFSAAVLNIKSAGDYERLVNKFGMRRSNEQFWSIFDLSEISSTSRKEKNETVRRPSSIATSASISFLRPLRKLFSGAVNSSLALVILSRFSLHLSLKYFPRRSITAFRVLRCPIAFASYSFATARGIA